MKLSDYVDQSIVLFVPRFHPTEFQDVRLVAVEAAGIWVVNQQMTNTILQHFNVASAPKGLAWFFPYTEIAFASVPTEGPALNEKAFDV